MVIATQAALQPSAAWVLACESTTLLGRFGVSLGSLQASGPSKASLFLVPKLSVTPPSRTRDASSVGESSVGPNGAAGWP